MRADELVKSKVFKDHSLRVTEPKLCDPSVKQRSGYLDITDGKHLFFWYVSGRSPSRAYCSQDDRFFESRSSPKDDPLVLWLNGGPGCSSSTGLLFELGPCSISDEGKNTTHNPHSWNSNAKYVPSLYP
jgi:cathepsin A (carboxypeptidase C)